VRRFDSRAPQTASEPLLGGQPATTSTGASRPRDYLWKLPARIQRRASPPDIVSRTPAGAILRRGKVFAPSSSFMLRRRCRRNRWSVSVHNIRWLATHTTLARPLLG
jgi:hypothetical protein